ncbi:carbohydrate kinase family protein [Actibacterium pelagium]|uniref:Carbohydrate kinase n=1 Tax=Actibacterium pelagium TaxID=2029103 RepID=A0A917EH69_9RHOB|nr:carbohydrate kinase [Actibacterium pelagium]GGE43006.1 carbohydrate kinase [Actibacterium pelagium]
MIVCCGEALIDMIPAKCGELQEDGFIPRAGGSVFNTAIALGRLGSGPKFLSCLSRDMFGDLLEQTLVNSRVGNDLCLRADRPSTMAYVKLTNGNATYVFYDENSAGRMIKPTDIPAIPDEVSTLFFGGISLAVEPCADTYADLAIREGTERVVMVDPNIRPGFIADETRFRERLRQMFQITDIVKVSDEDLEWLVPGDMTDQERAEKIIQQGPQLVLVTAGGDGVTCFAADGRSIKKEITPVEVVDTVGAGDTFNAGFLHSLHANGLLVKGRIGQLTDDQILKALGLGTQAAGVVVARSGANPPWADELDVL